MIRITGLATALSVLLLLSSACTPAKQAFLTVQLCVQNKAGVDQLIDDLKNVAIADDMDFEDSSAATEKNLAAVGYRGRERADGSPVITVGLLGKDGLFVGGGNLGLPGYQVQLGFTAGADDAKAHRFATQVVGQLKRRWNVHVLPRGVPARPMMDCH